LDSVVDIHRIDIGIGSKLKADRQIVSAVAPAAALHVDHLVDADHVGFQRLRHGRFEDAR
jgi:hypothetical protein